MLLSFQQQESDRNMFVIYCDRTHRLLGFKSQLCHLLVCDLVQITELTSMSWVLHLQNKTTKSTYLQKLLESHELTPMKLVKLPRTQPAPKFSGCRLSLMF